MIGDGDYTPPERESLEQVRETERRRSAREWLRVLRAVTRKETTP